MFWEVLHLELCLLSKMVRPRQVYKQRIGYILVTLSLVFLTWISSAQAQLQSDEWPEPYRLSSEAGKASEGYCVADQYGYVHCFWTEALFESQQSIIQYARFDGETWSTTNDIYITGIEIENVSPVVDQQGTLHIAWTEGRDGPAYYTHAPAHHAFSVQSWAQPVRIDIPAKTVQLRIDSRGVFHILYNNQADEPGVYYVRSEDQGTTWSEPAWLDPDIQPNRVPDSLNFELDENDGLHAVWFYGALDQNTSPDLVQYAHSADGGNSWTLPFTIDQAAAAQEHNLTNASPRMIVAGQTVHVVWAAGALPYRYHRFSKDAGQTWSPPRQIFGELHGQAFDSLVIDGAGRVHFFGQIRYPQGIYHAYWDNSQWTTPELIYLIAEEAEEDIGDRIHAHHTYAVVRAGNQLVLTFGDGPADPNRRLFAMHRKLDDLAANEVVPTPMITSTPVLEASPTPGPATPMPTATTLAPAIDTAAPSLSNAPTPGFALQVALISTLLLVGSTLIINWLYRRRL
jgi:hypothetical protein